VIANIEQFLYMMHTFFEFIILFITKVNEVKTQNCQNGRKFNK